MPQIFIDTNVYLDFYQSSKDRLAVFGELQQNIESIVFVQQSLKEFLRNRTERLSKLSKDVSNSLTSGIYTTAIITEMKEFKQIAELQRQIKVLGKSICNELDQWRDNMAMDPVLQAYHDLVMPAKNYFGASPEAFEKAKTRKLLGYPPTSPDKHTIGDELIWETLLACCQQDLIIVSRDKTFTNNFSVLQMEFNRPDRKLILITSSLSEALNKIGKNSKIVAQAESQMQNDILQNAQED